MCELENVPVTFVHDCSLPLSSLLCTVLVSRISESEFVFSEELTSKMQRSCRLMHRSPTRPGDEAEFFR